jgi:hypothetical protein
MKWECIEENVCRLCFHPTLKMCSYFGVTPEQCVTYDGTSMLDKWIHLNKNDSSILYMLLQLMISGQKIRSMPRSTH